MADVKLSSEAFNALLAGVDKSKLDAEQIAALDATKAELDKAEKAAALKEKLDTLNTQLLTNVSVYNEALNSIVDIPDEVNTIKLPYELMVSEDAETKEKSYSFGLSSVFPLVDDNFPYVSQLMSDFIKELSNQTKNYAKTSHNLLNTLANDETFVDRVHSKQSWEDNAGLNIKNRYSVESAIPFMNDIDTSILTDSEVKTGSVVVTYNSAELMKSNTNGKETIASWGITTAKFGKTTKYKSSNGGNGRKSKASDWIPAHSEAKSGQEYLIAEFSDDEKVAKAIEKHTTNGVLDTSKINANQHILRIEKDKPEAERHYTNYLASKK